MQRKRNPGRLAIAQNPNCYSLRIRRHRLPQVVEVVSQPSTPLATGFSRGPIGRYYHRSDYATLIRPTRAAGLWMKIMAGINIISGFRSFLLDELNGTKNNDNLYTMHIKDLILVYLNWRARLIPDTPRILFTSREYESYRNTHAHLTSIINIERTIQEGKSLSKYLSTNIRHKYISQCNSKAKDKDVLLNDLNVHHLHIGLGRHKVRHDFTERTGDILFALFTDQEAYLLDVLGHNDFGSPRLARIIIDNWPGSNFLIPLIGILPGVECSSGERHDLRKHGLQSTFIYNGVVYTASYGITMAGYSRRAVRAASAIYCILSKAQQCVERGEWSFIKEIYANSGLELPENAALSFGFRHYYFGLYEETAKLFLRLVRLP